MHKKEGASRAFVVTMCSLVDNPRSLNLKEGRSPHSPNDSLVTKQNCAFATNSFFTEKKKVLLSFPFGRQSSILLSFLN